MGRPREKIHRPQTRRRRENNEDSLEKMQAIRKNMKKGCEILEWLTRREQRKVNLAVRHISTTAVSLSSTSPAEGGRF